MKIRTDFVTNSSSSSFICCFAKISKLSHAGEFIRKLELQDDLKSGKDLKEDMQSRWFDLGADWASVYIDVDEDDIDENALYLVYESHGGAGSEDYEFQNEYGDIDYNVSLSDFTKLEQEIYESICEENGFTEIQQGYGAGRNG